MFMNSSLKINAKKKLDLDKILMQVYSEFKRHNQENDYNKN